jgi:uncharacterized protein YihD (DUF1040 family)
MLIMEELRNVEKEIEFTVDKLWDVDAVLEMLNILVDLAKKSGYKVSYVRSFRRFKVRIEKSDSSEKV